MPIKSFRIENFKSIGNSQYFEFGKLNLIFGPNSSGKSSVLQAILLLNNILNEGENDVSESRWGVELGGFANYVHLHNQDSTVKLTAEFEVHPDNFIRASSRKPRRYMIGVEISKIGLSRASYFEDSQSIFTIELVERVIKGSSSNKKSYRYRIANLDMNSFGIRDTTEDYFEKFDQLYAYGNTSSRRLIFSNLVKYHIDRSRDIDFGDIVIRSKSPTSLFANAVESVDIRNSSVRNSLSGSLTRVKLDSLIEYKEYFDRDYVKLLDKFLLPLQNEKNNRRVGGYINLESALSISQLSNEEKEGIGRYVSIIGLIEDYADHYLDYIIGIHRMCANETKSISHIGPVRWHPNRRLYESELKRNNLPEYRNWLSLFGASRQVSLVNSMLESLSLPYEIKVSKVFLENRREKSEDSDYDRVLELIDKKSDINVAYRDVGTGISQVIPILVGLSRNNKILSMEQPELHLHPAMQSRLMDVVIGQQFNHRSRDKMILIETHSEHMILRLQRRIREGQNSSDAASTISSNSVKILFTLPTSFGLQIVNLELDDDGSFIDPWPGGFFEERLGELTK